LLTTAYNLHKILCLKIFQGGQRHGCREALGLSGSGIRRICSGEQAVLIKNMFRTAHLSCPRPGSQGACRRLIIISRCSSLLSLEGSGLASKGKIYNHGNKTQGEFYNFKLQSSSFIMWPMSQGPVSRDTTTSMDYGNSRELLFDQAWNVTSMGCQGEQVRIKFFLRSDMEPARDCRWKPGG
jgi:hypothetical protein